MYLFASRLQKANGIGKTVETPVEVSTSPVTEVRHQLSYLVLIKICHLNCGNNKRFIFDLTYLLNLK